MPIPVCGVSLVEVWHSEVEVLSREISTRGVCPCLILLWLRKMFTSEQRVKAPENQPFWSLILKYETQIIQEPWPELKNKPDPKSALTGSDCLYLSSKCQLSRSCPLLEQQVRFQSCHRCLSRVMATKSAEPLGAHAAVANLTAPLPPR